VGQAIKGHPFIIAITLSTANQFSYYLAHIYARKFGKKYDN